MPAAPQHATTGEVSAAIEFIAAGGERPFAYGYEPAPADPAPTARFERRAARIHDLRHGGSLALDANGATLLHRPTACRQFDDPAQVRARYYPECAAILQEALGARRVVVYDHNVRRGERLGAASPRADGGRPVHHAHTDYTPRSARRRALQLALAEGGELLRHRFVQVNLWRPLRAPLREAPLAICDGASVAPADLRTVELLYRDRIGEIFYLAHSSRHRWHFASDMTADEVWVIKNVDADPASPGRVAPHAAFELGRRDADVPPRESIEVRAFAFFGPAGAAIG